MASPGTPVKEAAPQSSWTSVPGLVGEWIRQGTEGFIATQKILLDLAAQQNALALTIVRERLGLISPTPSKKLVDLTGKGLHNVMHAQQILLDIAARQNSIVADGLKPGFEGTPIEGLAEIVHQGLDNFIGAQKKFLEIFEAETEGALNDYGDGKRFDTTRLSDFAREGMRNFLRSQKKFLDIVEEQLTTKKETATETADTERKGVDLFEMAKQSVDAYVEAQKRLLDLASEQIDVNVKFVRELFTVDTEAHPATALPDVVKKSVDSFVAAQKALVDLASKPRKPLHETKEQEDIVVVSDVRPHRRRK